MKGQANPEASYLGGLEMALGRGGELGYPGDSTRHTGQDIVAEGTCQSSPVLWKSSLVSHTLDSFLISIHPKNQVSRHKSGQTDIWCYEPLVLLPTATQLGGFVYCSVRSRDGLQTEVSLTSAGRDGNLGDGTAAPPAVASPQAPQGPE